MSAPQFLDTNIILRYLTRDDEEKAIAALALFQRLEHGTERVLTSQLVIFDVVFTLDRFYKLPRTEIQTVVSDIVSLPGLQLQSKGLILDALALFASHPKRIAFADAYNAVFAQSRGATEVYSWDTDFDSIPGITRIEPAMPDDPAITGVSIEATD